MSIIEKALGRLGPDAKEKQSLARSRRTAVPRSVQGAQSPPLPRADAGAVGAHQETLSSEIPGTSGPRPLNPPRAAAVAIPFDCLHEQGYLTPAVPRSTIAEEFRIVKRPLLGNIAGRSPTPIATPNLVMVTSALQGDGKTFSAINLAMSIAMEQDKTVLFVDADVVKGTAGHMLGVPEGSPGLIDLLMDTEHVQPQDVILHTNIKKLRILPAGNSSEHATELLASSTMHEFMLELAHRYPDRVIVFDSPPLLLTTEAAVLASFMGQIVFVAAADFTPQNAVKEALERIGDDKFVGVLLNRMSRRRARLFGLGYNYGYGYAYGYGDEKVGAARAAAEGARSSMPASSVVGGTPSTSETPSV